MKELCKDCRYLGQRRAGILTVDVCRKNPPRVQAFLSPQGHAEVTSWPRIDDKNSDWCGEYRANYSGTQERISEALGRHEI
jgi:hypothetical protein